MTSDRVFDEIEAEQQILQLISARAPIPKILNEICYALDCQIGNVVSVVSLTEEKSLDVAEIGKNAKLFGLHVFFATEIATGVPKPAAIPVTFAQAQGRAFAGLTPRL